MVNCFALQLRSSDIFQKRIILNEKQLRLLVDKPHLKR